MKNSFKSVIFAVTLGSFLISANIVKANDRDSAKSEVMLVKGAEVNFANFMSKKAKKFVKTEDWVIFVNVVKLYNNSPAKFMALSTTQKAAFNEAAISIEAKVSDLRGLVEFTKEADLGVLKKKRLLRDQETVFIPECCLKPD